MTTYPLRSAEPLTELAVGRAIDDAIATVVRNADAWIRDFPDDTTVGGRYFPRVPRGDIRAGGNHGWTTSFCVGMLWLAWEARGDVRLRDAAIHLTDSFIARVDVGDDLETHDLGFLFSLSGVATWNLTGSESARRAALDAADHLMRRFLEPAGVIQAWGDLSDPRQSGRAIIDSLMNMPLLTWASQQTGDPRYARAVTRHTAQLHDHILRADNSTFHTFYWDAVTGVPLRGATEQGAFDASCWARGQAWGIYGFALNAQATGERRLLDAAWRCADYFLDHLPADRVPFWDLVYQDGDDAPRDSSAGAIAVCGLLELARVDDRAERRERALVSADAILEGLISGYTPARPADVDTLLLHGVYDYPNGIGVDEGNLWGDYYFLEALMRRRRWGWTPAW